MTYTWCHFLVEIPDYWKNQNTIGKWRVLHFCAASSPVSPAVCGFRECGGRPLVDGQISGQELNIR